MIGSNNQGQLGDGTTTSPRSVYVAMNLAPLAGRGVSFLATASNTLYLVTTDGLVYRTGHTGVATSTTLALLNNMRNIVAISAYGSHFMALSSNNQLWVGGAGNDIKNIVLID